MKNKYKGLNDKDRRRLQYERRKRRETKNKFNSLHRKMKKMQNRSNQDLVENRITNTEND